MLSLIDNDFIRSMGNINDGKSVLTMYHKDYEAALYNYCEEENDYRISHPTLEDNNVADWEINGVDYYGHKWDYIDDKYDQFPPDDPNVDWNDGWLAYNTYL